MSEKVGYDIYTDKDTLISLYFSNVNYFYYLLNYVYIHLFIVHVYKEGFLISLFRFFLILGWTGRYFGKDKSILILPVAFQRYTIETIKFGF